MAPENVTTVKVYEESLDSLRRAVVLVHGRLRGVLLHEVSEALEAHASRLMAKQEAEG